MDLRTPGGGRVNWDKVRQWYGHIYTTKCKIDSQWEAAAQHREISSLLCDHLEGWARDGGRETQEGGDTGTYVYVQLIHFVIKQKLTHYVKQLYSNKDVKKKKAHYYKTMIKLPKILIYVFVYIGLYMIIYMDKWKINMDYI